MATTATRFAATTDRATYSGAAGNPPIPAAGWSAAWWAYIAVDRDDYSTMLRVHAGDGGSTILNVAMSQSGTGVSVYTVGGSVEGVANLAVGQWYYLAISVLATTCAAYVFDAGGALVAATSGTISASAQPTGLTLGGRSAADPDEWFNGRLSRMRIWSAVLSQAEFVAEQFATQPARAGDLWAHYRLAGATDLVDLAGGHDLVAGTTATITEDGPPLPTGVSGSALAALSGLSVAALGVRTVLGAGAATLGALDAAAIASRKVLGISAVPLGGPVATATGRRTVTGPATVNLGALTATTTARRTVFGSALAALGPLNANVVLIGEHDVRVTASLAPQGRVRGQLGARRVRAELGAQR